MEFVFLGTSSGIPTRSRNVSGLVIKSTQERAWYLVDCGEGTQHQLLRLPYSLVNLHSIYITHVHGDHSYGLPGLLASASMAGREASLTIYAPAGVEEFVRAAMRYSDMHMSYEIHFKRVEACETFPVARNVSVNPVALNHRVPSYGYLFECNHRECHLDTEKLLRDNISRGPLWGEILRQEQVQLDSGQLLRSSDYHLPPLPPQRVFVGGDNDDPYCMKAIAEAGVDVIIHEATYTQEVSDKVGPKPQHTSAKKIARFAETLAVPNLVLTHFSARYHHSHHRHSANIQEVEDEARSNYSGCLYLANDFDHFVLKRDHGLALQRRSE